jgi:hypothetical protein
MQYQNFAIILSSVQDGAHDSTVLFSSNENPELAAVLTNENHAKASRFLLKLYDVSPSPIIGILIDSKIRISTLADAYHKSIDKK